ncbi:MAG: hypothetical protein ACOCP4_07580 [Candidatus Woesearchaeota archaeon]
MLFNETIKNHNIEFYSKNQQLYVRHNDKIYEAMKFLKNNDKLTEIIRNELSKFIKNRLSNSLKKLSLIKIVEIFSRDISPPDIRLNLNVDNDESITIKEIKFDINEFESGLAKFLLMDKNFD